MRRLALLLGPLAAVLAGCGSSHRAIPCNRLPGRGVPILRDIHHIAYVLTSDPRAVGRLADDPDLVLIDLEQGAALFMVRR